MLNIRLLFILISFMGLFFVTALPLQAQTSKKAGCGRWQAEIDESLGSKDIIVDIDKLSNEEVMTAIGCLLGLQGNRNKARFGGAMRTDVSSVPQFTSVEVAALYYISYLYYQKFDHATVVALYDGSGKFSTPYSVKEAFASYRKWFEVVKKVGLANAREQKLDPLAHTKVRWY